MIDHITLRVRDLAATRAFYLKALAPLGYRVGYDAEHDGVGILGFGFEAPGVGFKIDTWFVDRTEPLSGPTHVCWKAPSRAAVDAFHAAALAAGGIDNGAPGVREHYHPNYYGAFVRDPDGHNVEAVCHSAP
ncbi:MAG: VOC family protein [Proteobacteria bacterium]|nr:VOC family protein [Pseudomonadota bacterium]